MKYITFPFYAFAQRISHGMMSLVCSPFSSSYFTLKNILVLFLEITHCTALHIFKRLVHVYFKVRSTWSIFYPLPFPAFHVHRRLVRLLLSDHFACYTQYRRSWHGITPLLFNLLFKYLFSIKFLYYFNVFLLLIMLVYADNYTLIIR